LLPSHWSSEHGLPSDVQAVPFVFFESPGHVLLPPVQVSARSHSPAAARQVVAAEAKVHDDVQHDGDPPLPLPRSHCSGLSSCPSPQSE
jgi:hypothetical protein